MPEYNVVNQVLDKFSGKNHLPIISKAPACQFADYFTAKIEQIYGDMSRQIVLRLKMG